ncbi:MAG TPA: hypothetical protein VNZ22_03840, partial [Bacillota bacterium]|nr:hypothetical protein [Bacillota bacterium]
PRHTAEYTLANGVGYAAQLTLQTIGQEWAKQDPAGALAFAASAPGGPGLVLANAALKQWAEGHLEAAATWLGAADERTRSRLSPAFVEAWAQKDAGEALKWCGENLTGSSLAQAVGGVLKGAAAKDVASAAGLVTAMAPSPARSEGAEAVGRKWFPGLSSGEAVAPAAVTWLGGLDGNSLQRVMEAVQWEWATSDPKSMAAFLSTTSSEQIPEQAYLVLARQMARRNPLETLAWASGLPAERGLEAGSGAYAEWWNSQREAATEWLKGLPASDKRREAFFQSAIRTLAYNPQGAEQMASLSSAEQAAARKVIEGMTLPEERRAHLLEAVRGR